MSSPSRSISNRQLVLMTAPAAVLMAFIFFSLVVVYGPQLVYAVLGLVPPDAVQVSATTNGWTFTSHRISDARTVSDLYARINHLPYSIRGRNCWLSLSDPVTYTYTFRFTRGETPIEVASTTGNRECISAWQIARGGICERSGYCEAHLDLTGAATPTILAEAQLPPLP